MTFEEQLDACKIGQPHDILTTTEEDQIRLAAIHLVKQAHREILILSQELEPMIFGHHDFIEDLRSFIANRNSRMRVLVTRDRKIVQGSHRMIHTTRRFSSTITMHRLDPRKYNFKETWMLCDDVALLYRPNPDHYEATLDCYTPGQGAKLKKQFEQYWQDSRPIPEVGTLGV